ncbi:DUF3784 domain-containing protein [Enterococcus sp. LJL128]
MQFSDEIIQYLLLITTIVISIQLIRGKWLMLIAGYNTIEPEKRKETNGPALGKAVGTFLLYIDLVLILSILFPATSDYSFVLILIPLAFLLIFVNTSPRFKN